MITSLLYHYMISCVFSRHNSPIVIERPLNRIEFDDLLMEYNTEEGPTANVSVSVIITLNSARIYDDILRTSITMEQIWRDMRLSFKGVSEVPLPNSVRIWQPDTVILNALSYDTKMTSLFLNFDGTIRKKQLLFVEVLCDESPNVTMKSDILECSLELTSFSNRGCEQITYSVEKINNDRIARISNATVMNDTVMDYSNRTTYLSSVILHLQKPPFIFGDLIDKITKTPHL